MLNAGAVIPTPVKDDDLTGSWKMLHVTLDIHLAFFPIRWCRQGEEAEYTRADPFGDGADGAALSSGVAPLKNNNHAQALILYPVLQFAKLCLKPPELFLVFFPLEGVLALRLLFFGHCNLLLVPEGTLPSPLSLAGSR